MSRWRRRPVRRGATRQMAPASSCHSHAKRIPLASQSASVRAEEENDMPATQTLTCPLCGLQYTNGMLLELHIREDHVHQDHRAPPDRGNPSSSGTGQPTLEARPAGPPSAPVKVLTTKTPASRSRSWFLAVAITPLAAAARGGRQVVRALRHADEELLGAFEAMLRSARFRPPSPRPEAPAPTDAHPGPGKAE